MKQIREFQSNFENISRDCRTMVNCLVFVKFQNKEERIFQRIEKHENMHQRNKIIVFRLIKCIIIKDQEIFSTLSVIPGNCQVNSPWSYMVRRNHSEL